MSSRAEGLGEKPFPFMDYVRKIHVPNLFGKDSPRQTNNEPETSPTGFTPDQNPDLLILPQEPIDRKKDIERWMYSQRSYRHYKAGVHSDGTPYEEGVLLLIDQEQVMDTCETPWVEKTVEGMFAGQPEKPLRAIERGTGLRIQTKNILNHMARRGGESVSVELNQQIYEDTKDDIHKMISGLRKAQKWGLFPHKELEFIHGGLKDDNVQRYITEQSLSELKKSKLTIVLILGDADEVTKEFPKRHFKLIFSDTHQLRPEERGINDLLVLGEVTERLEDPGRFTFCAFHGGNPNTETLDPVQYMLVTRHFGKRTEEVVELYVPPHILYFPKGRTIVRVPRIICEDPKRLAA